MTRSPHFIVQSVIVQMPTQVCRGAAVLLKTLVVITPPPEGRKANETKPKKVLNVFHCGLNKSTTNRFFFFFGKQCVVSD